MSKVVLVAVVALSGCQETKIRSVEKSPQANEAAIFTWKESGPKDQGMNEELLNQIDEDVTRNYAKLYSLLVVKNGSIVYEKYYHYKNKDTYTNVFSVTKSIVSALTGIALQKGFLKSTDQKISEFLSEYFANQDDPRKKDITIRHVLTMNGGLDPVDRNIQAWFQSRDWIADTIDKPMVKDPGTGFGYNTGLTHVLSGVLAKATGLSTKSFADRYLFGPLNITNYQWEQDPKGIYSGGTNLYLTPRDMAKFGYLYLHKGEWEGNQIIPKDWVEASIQKQVTDANYGYLFWIQDKKPFSFEANGYGGQYIRIIPELDTVVVITSNANLPGGSNPIDLINKYIIPAVNSTFLPLSSS
jgi:CubicO group peptidase (beta-lactamase class C family)